MKIRAGFVSNSSSASFVIKNYKDVLSPFQRHRLINHQFFMEETNDGWSITEHGKDLSGSTVMDNGYLPEYMVNELLIDPRLIEYCSQDDTRADDELPKPKWIKAKEDEDEEK
jgi:hypothetical protein